MKVENFWTTRGYICWEIRSLRSNNLYRIRYDRDYDLLFCDCLGYLFNKQCRHLNYVKKHYDYGHKRRKEQSMRFWKSSCEAIDEILGIPKMDKFGVPHGSIVGVFSEPNYGKSWMVYQIAHSILKQFRETEGYEDKRVVIFDTEEAGGEMSYEFKNMVFQERFGLDESPEVISTPTLDELLQYFGKRIDFDRSDSGKIKGLSIHDRDGRLTEKIDWNEVGFVAIDSLTSPVKGEIGRQTRDFGARADVQSFLMKQLQKLEDMVKLVVLHASINPTTFAKGKPQGGDDIFYNTKYLMQIVNPRKKEREEFGDNSKRLRVFRHPVKPNTKKKDWKPVIQKEDYGFISPNQLEDSGERDDS